MPYGLEGHVDLDLKGAGPLRLASVASEPYKRHEPWSGSSTRADFVSNTLENLRRRVQPDGCQESYFGERKEKESARRNISPSLSCNNSYTRIRDCRCLLDADPNSIMSATLPGILSQAVLRYGGLFQ